MFSVCYRRVGGATTRHIPGARDGTHRGMFIMAPDDRRIQESGSRIPPGEPRAHGSRPPEHGRADASRNGASGGRGSAAVEDRRDEAEARLLTTARRLIARLGWAGTTLADAGEAAGYSRGLAGHYFGSKAGLLRAITGQINNNMMAECARRLRPRQASARSWPSSARTRAQGSLSTAAPTQLRLFDRQKRSARPLDLPGSQSAERRHSAPLRSPALERLLHPLKAEDPDRALPCLSATTVVRQLCSNCRPSLPRRQLTV